MLISLQMMTHTIAQSTAKQGRVRVAVAGISHGHAAWIFNRQDTSDMEIVGVYETDKVLIEKYRKDHKLAASLFYDDLNKMLDELKPAGVVAFGSIYDHMKVVEAAAPRGIHVMVEKPLATNIAHAFRMQALVTQHNIHLLTNYETSWYPATEKTYQLVHDSAFVGKLRKAVFHHGHQGPQEIGVGKEFFEWLTDPVQNGGGALIDFGCYGANIMTWLMKGKKPLSVTAVTQQYKPSIYPKVDDDATIIVDYGDAQAIIQASWNWPYNRKDMEVYGDAGYVTTFDHSRMQTRKGNNEPRRFAVTTNDIKVYTDPFKYFSDVITKRITVPSYGLYSLENNLLVVQILDAARESARTGKKIEIK